LGRSVVGLARQPVRALRSIPTAGPNLDQVPAMRIIPGAASLAKLARRAAGLRGGARDGGLLERPSHHAPRTILNGRISPHRAVAFGSLSLSDAKAIKTALGVTVNDVIVALCAGAVRSWLAERDALPAEPLVAMVPMSVRTAGEHGTFGNRIAMMLVTLPSDEPDPRARVARAHEVMRSAKERHRALPATLLQDANHFVPPALFGRASRVIASLSVSDRFQPPMNLVISNVPGSPAPLYCAGARLEATYPVSAIADGVGLNITAFSYRESVDFGVVADRELVREPAAIVAALHAELDALRTLARAGVR
jgi:WS/DGAT/MGAT family acyltransferase